MRAKCTLLMGQYVILAAIMMGRQHAEVVADPMIARRARGSEKRATCRDSSLFSRHKIGVAVIPLGEHTRSIQPPEVIPFQ